MCRVSVFTLSLIPTLINPLISLFQMQCMETKVWSYERESWPSSVNVRTYLYLWMSLYWTQIRCKWNIQLHFNIWNEEWMNEESITGKWREMYQKEHFLSESCRNVLEFNKMVCLENCSWDDFPSYCWGVRLAFLEPNNSIYDHLVNFFKDGLVLK